MAINYNNDEATFSAVVYEDETLQFRDFLQQKAGNELRFNFNECEDIHFAVLQLIMAYKKNYSCIYEFSNEKKIYEKVLEGFDPSENNCN
jgi:TorA maturation chaperone TorD